MEDKMQFVLDGFKKYEVTNYFKEVLKLNPSNMLPYHNLNHIVVMCYHLLKCIQLYGISHNDARLLLIAGLYHDWSHSGGKLTDKENVDIAISGMVCSFVFNEVEGNTNDIEEITNIIKATEYPYVIPHDELSLLQKIIRDCDLLMYFEDNWLHQVIMGLKEEMNLTIEKVLFGVITFIHEMKFSTTYGQEIYNQKSSQLIANVTRLLEILTIEK